MLSEPKDRVLGPVPITEAKDPWVVRGRWRGEISHCWFEKQVHWRITPLALSSVEGTQQDVSLKMTASLDLASLGGGNSVIEMVERTSSCRA